MSGTGWKPIVVAAEAQAFPIRDPTLTAEIPPDVPVYRLSGLDVNGWRPTFARLHLGKVHAMLNTLLALPDSAVFWSWLARRVVRKVIAMHEPQLIYTTSGPFSAHLLGLWIKNSFGLPWVADFRDPWSQKNSRRYLPGYRWANQCMEHQVLSSADHIVTVSHPIARSFKELMRPADTPVSVIPNGYDPDDVSPSPPVQTPKFTLTYTGGFRRLRRPDTLLEAVSSLVDSGKIPVDQIQVLFAGSNMDAFVPTRPPFVKLGYLPHNDLGPLRQRSTVLLLVQNPSLEARGNYSAKLFEYLAANRPILAVTSPETVAAELIREACAGTVVNHDPEEIKSVLLDCYRAWEAGEMNHSPNWDIISRFSRPRLTTQLTAIFDDLLDQ
jgi:glycosyltransferase involved in cell wall biosynthesis